MIYLVGGAPRLGKSTTAQKVTKRSQHISTEDIRQAVVQRTLEEERKTLFPLSEFPGDPFEHPMPAQERVALHIIEAHSLQPEIEHIITKALKEKRSMLLEGIHLLPETIRDAVKKNPKKVRGIIIGSKDIPLIVQGIQAHKPPKGIAKISNTVRRQIAEFIATYSAWIQTEAESCQLPYIERTASGKEDIERISSLLT